MVAVVWRQWCDDSGVVTDVVTVMWWQCSGDSGVVTDLETGVVTVVW